MSAPLDREQLRRDLSDTLSAIQRDHDVTGLDVLAASLTTTLEDLELGPGPCQVGAGYVDSKTPPGCANTRGGWTHTLTREGGEAMGNPILPDPAGPAKLYTRQAHLAVLVGQHEGPRGCLICRQPFQTAEDRRPPPICERCTAPLGHFTCYLAQVALAAREREFFANPEELGLDVILLCLGCRS